MSVSRPTTPDDLIIIEREPSQQEIHAKTIAALHDAHARELAELRMELARVKQDNEKLLLENASIKESLTGAEQENAKLAMEHATLKESLIKAESKPTVFGNSDKFDVSLIFSYSSFWALKTKHPVKTKETALQQSEPALSPRSRHQ